MGVVALGVFLAACTKETTSSPSRADASAEILALWEERPAPPAGATIGVYVELGPGAPKGGTLTLSSREARICTTVPAAADTGGLAPDAGPPACPFAIAITTDGGPENFAVVLVLVSATVPPLVTGVVANAANQVVSSIFRRFYYAAPASPMDAGMPSDGSSAPMDAGEGASDGGSQAMDTDTNVDGATIEVGGE